MIQQTKTNSQQQTANNIPQQVSKKFSSQLQPVLTLGLAIKLTESLLTDLIQSQSQECQSIFNSQQVPEITLSAYLTRLHKYTKFSPQCLILSIVYLDRYNMAESQFSLNWYNVHRFILTCLILAAKFHDDVYFDNRTYERGGGVPAKQLLTFQIQMLQKLEFSVFVAEEEYEELVDRLLGVYGSRDQQDSGVEAEQGTL